MSKNELKSLSPASILGLNSRYLGYVAVDMKEALRWRLARELHEILNSAGYDV